jgi:energy-coupling factor transport system permease protein
MAKSISLYISRASVIHKLNPVTKLAVSGLLLAGSLSLPGLWPSYAFFLFVLMPLALLAHVLKELLDRTWRIALPFAVSVFLIQGFLWPQGTPILALGPLSLKQEGVFFATASTGRILIVVSAFLWLALTTQPDSLMIVLAQRGLPPSIAYIIVSTLQIAPRFQTRANTIVDAQRARGLETGGRLPQRIRALVPLVVPLVLSSLVDVEKRALAVEARAFNRPGPKTSLVEIQEASWEPALQWALLLLMIASILAGIWLRIV